MYDAGSDLRVAASAADKGGMRPTLRSMESLKTSRSMASLKSLRSMRSMRLESAGEYKLPVHDRFLVIFDELVSEHILRIPPSYSSQIAS